MAEGAAKQRDLGVLHARITTVFQKVLARYEKRLDAIDDIDPTEFESAVLEELFNDNAMPNPAMLAAVSKFLKDNEISFDSEQVAALSDQERRLAERREKRGTLVDLTALVAQNKAQNG